MSKHECPAKIAVMPKQKQISYWISAVQSIGYN